MNIRRFIGIAFVAMVLMSNGCLAFSDDEERGNEWRDAASVALKTAQVDLELNFSNNRNKWEVKGKRRMWGNAENRKIWIDKISTSFNAITKYISEMPESDQGKMDPKNQSLVTSAKDLILGKINTLFINGLPMDSAKLAKDCSVGVLTIDKQIKDLKIIEGSFLALNNDKKMTVIIKKFLSKVLDLLLQMYQQAYQTVKPQTTSTKKK